MQFRLVSVISVALGLVLGPAAAVDISFTNNSACAPNAGQYTINGAHPDTCYPNAGRAPSARSVLVSNISQPARAQAYDGEPGRCETAADASSASGSICLRARNSHNIQTARYSAMAPRRVLRRTPEAEPRFSVTYEQPGGVYREIEVQHGHVERALGLVEAKDYDTLAGFPTVS